MATEKTEKKRPGRKPMTEEQKAAAAKLRATEKEKAKSMKPTVFLQYQGAEIQMEALIDVAIADFKSENKRKRLTSLEVYVKPEDSVAYYVANNGAYTGKISF